MTLPSLLIGILISSLIGSLFHLWRGGGAGRLLLYLLLAWIGFWGGHSVGAIQNWNFLSLGPLRLGMAAVGSLVTLSFGYWLSLSDKTTTD
ncbi:MAG: hypothetical protein H8E28_11045 [Anaerolineae bacterium]|nr:hypothetical protein [Anaerolineae bacterium]MBL6965538.1 hypothetical protein [Anaerolineales bacterium]